jgi:outer membrane protein assembly factor BamE (lipoprotein component of BamABCDE complex)
MRKISHFILLFVFLNICTVSLADITTEPDKSHLLRQKMIEKWRALQTGMTTSQVRNILGNPKLILGGSHASYWFYQKLPVSASGPNFIRIKDKGNKRGKPGAKHILSDINGVRHGVIFFKAASVIDEIYKSYDDTVLELKKEHEFLIEKMQRARNHNREQRLKYNNIINKEKSFQRVQKSIDERYSESLDNAEKDLHKQLKNIRKGGNLQLLPLELNMILQPDWKKPKTLKKTNKMQKIKKAKEKWLEPIRWRRLRMNMSLKQVHTIIGHPRESISDIKGTREYYGDVPGYGELLFSARDDLKTYLSFWIEPFWPDPEGQRVPAEILPFVPKPEEVEKQTQNISTTTLSP